MSNHLDMDVVDELISLTGDGDPELLLDLIDMFLEDAPTKVATISNGLQENDMDKVAGAAHSLKGSSGNLGARFVQADCDALQNASRQREEQTVATIVPQLEEHFTQAVVALEELRSRYQ